MAFYCNKTVINTDEKFVAYLHDFNYKFFQVILGETNNVDNFFTFNENLEEIYSKVKDKYLARQAQVILETKNLSAVQNDYSSVILNKKNWSNYIAQHSRFLKQYMIQIPTYELAEEEELGRDTYSWFEDDLIDLVDLIPNEIKMLLASVKAQPNSRFMPDLVQKYRVESAVSIREFLSYLRNQLANQPTAEDMIQKLVELAPKVPEIGILMSRLGLNTNGTIKTTTAKQAILLGQFFRSFTSSKVIPLVNVLTPDGNILLRNAVDITNERVLADSWRTNMEALADKKGSYITTDQGLKVIKVKPLMKDLNILLSKKSINKNQALSILENLGIVLSSSKDDVKNIVPAKNYLIWLKDNLKRISDSGIRLVTTDMMFNRDIVKNQAELEELIRYAATLTVNNQDLSFINAEGNVEQAVGLNSRLTHTIQKLNDQRAVEHLMPYNLETGLGNLYATHSIYGNLLEQGQKIEVASLKGYATPNTSKKVKKVKPGEYKALQFNLLLNGWVPIIRLGDRGSDFALKIHQVDKNSDVNTFKAYATDYLKDELITSFALMVNGLGSDLKNYNKNAKKLRTFSFLYDQELNQNNRGAMPPSLEQYISDIEGPIPMQEIFNLADQYVQDYNNYINDSLEVYYDTLVEKNWDSLVDAGIIQFTGITYILPGVFNDTFDSYKNIMSKGKIGVLTRDSVRNLVEVATIQDFVGKHEQLKLLFGDPAAYVDAKDFHKRATGLGSTKTHLLNDKEYVESLNDSYPKLIGKHETSFYKIIYDDVKGANVQDAIYARDSIVGTDAQAGILLDSYRSMMVRHGAWSDQQEKTYQYEMQRFALRVLENPRYKEMLGIPDDIFTKGVFAEHTGGKAIKVPMYKGKPIKIEELGSLTILKPMGFGPILNPSIENLVANQYFKQSLAPIFPSELGEDMFEKYVTWMSKGSDVISFLSAEKIDVITREDGSLNQWDDNQDIVLQEMSFDDFGIQLEIHEDNEKGITPSTQRQKIEFVDVFANGKPIKDEKLKGLRDEYNTLLNKHYEINREKLIEYLGLTRQSDGTYTLPLEARQDFKQKLIEAFESRMMPLNSIKGIDLAVDSEEIIFDSLIDKQQIEQVLLALVKNRAIRRKVNGALLIQESNIFFDDKLKFYRKQKDKVLPMEVMISLPTTWVPFVESIGGLDVFNKAIAERDINLLGEDFFQLLEFSANRVPTQSPNSLEAVQIVKFLNHYGGPRIVLPPEITVKSGSDFDVDKLTSYLYNAVVTKKGIKPIKYITNTSKDSLTNYYNEVLGPAKKRAEKLKALAFDSYETNINKILGEYIYFNDFLTRLGFDVSEVSVLPEGGDPLVEKGLVETLAKLGIGYQEYLEIIKKGDQIPSLEEFLDENVGKKAIDFNNLGAIENRLNEVSFISLLHPERFDDLTRANSSKILENAADRIPTETDEPTFSNITETYYNWQKAYEFWTSSANIGLAAIQNVSHAFSQQFPSKINNDAIEIFFKGQERKEGEFYQDGHIKDTGGFIISENFAQFLTAFVDAVKDPFIFKLNIVPEVFQAYSFLNRFGIKGGTSIDLLTQFFTQPSILRYYKLIGATMNSFHYNNRYGSEFMSYKKVREKVFRELQREGKIREHVDNVPTSYERTIAYLVEEYMKEEDPVNKEKIATSIKSRIEKFNYKHLTVSDLQKDESSPDFYKIQLQIFDNFLTYLSLGQALGSLNTLLRPDASSSAPGSLHESDSMLVLNDYVKSLGIFDNEIIDEQLTSDLSQLKEAHKTHSEISKMFQWSFMVHRDPHISNFFYKAFTEFYYDPGNKSKLYANKKTKRKTIRDIELEFMSFLYSASPENVQSVPEYQNFYYTLMSGPWSIPKRMLKEKTLDSTNLFLNKVNIRTAFKLDNRTQRKSETDVISLLEKRLPPLELDLITNSMEDLIRDYPQLVDFAMMQSGQGNSPETIMKVLPSAELFNRLHGDLIEFMKLPFEQKQNKLLLFREQMYRNRWWDTNIVPRLSGIKNRGNFRRSFNKPSYAKIPYVTRAYYNATGPEVRKLKEEGLKPPVEIALYKNVGGGYFELINKLGNGFRFREYYPTGSAHTLSVLSSNSYKDAPETRSALFVKLQEAVKEDVPTKLAEIMRLIQLGDYTSAIQEGDNEANEHEEFEEDEDSMAALNTPSRITEPVIEELNNNLKEFFKAINVKYQEVEEIAEQPDVISLSNFVTKTVQVVNGELAERDLPEEAAHWYVKLLGTDHPLYKSMMKDIVKYPVYNDVKKEYFDFYKGNEVKIREEAVGKLIAEYMAFIHKQGSNLSKVIGDNSETQVDTWWKMLWNYITKMFRNILNNDYAKSAYNILSRNLSEIQINQTIKEKDQIGLRDISVHRVFSNRTINALKTFANVSNMHELMTLADSEYALKRRLQRTQGFGKKTIEEVLIEYNKYLPVFQKNMTFEDILFDEIQDDTGVNYYGYEPHAKKFIDSISHIPGITISMQSFPIGKGRERFVVFVRLISPTIVNRDLIKSKNIEELYKEVPEETITDAKSRLLQDFDKFYPQYSHLELHEKEAFVDGLNLGIIDQLCGL